MSRVYRFAEFGVRVSGRRYCAEHQLHLSPLRAEMHLGALHQHTCDTQFGESARLNTEIMFRAYHRHGAMCFRRVLSLFLSMNAERTTRYVERCQQRAARHH
jgi:hypothetical protein